MDYGQKESEYNSKEIHSGHAKYYIVPERQEVKEQKQVDFYQLIRNIPKGGSIASMPEYHDGVIYLTSLDTHLYAIDAETGKTIWKFKTGAPSVSSPLIHKNQIYFGSHDEYFYCLSLNGKLLWKKQLGDIAACYPTACGDNIFTTAGKNMFCFSEDGTQLWKFATGGGMFATPALINGFVTFSSFDGNTYCLDIDGNLVWKFFTGGFSSSPLVFSDGKPIVTVRDRSWNKMPYAKNPVLYVACNNNFLYALNVEGKLLWKYNMGSSAASILTGNDGVIYSGTVSGHLHAINSDGKSIWKFLTGGMITAAPIVHYNKIYFGSWDQKLYCLSEDGEKIWDFLTGGPIAAEATIVGNKLYVGSADTFLYCIDIEKRSVDWTFQCGFGLPENLQAKLTDINNTLVEYDRKIFKVWAPETLRGKMQGAALQSYSAPQGFEFGGEQAYKSNSSLSDYFGKKGIYKK